jgi:8-oxo-dGTP diphosphatase
MSAGERNAVPRRAARVILLDATGRVLLIRYQVEDFSFWATPGGAVETGERDEDAAARELLEELQIRVTLSAAPVHQAVGRFHHEGVFVENTDVFFAAHLDAAAPRLYGTTAFEAEAMKEVRWWTADDLRATQENIFPRELAALMERVSQERLLPANGTKPHVLS